MSFDVSATTGVDAYRARLLVPDDPGDAEALGRLRSDPAVEFTDHRDAVNAALRGLRPGPDPDLLTEPSRWAYFSWRRAVVAIPGPRAFRRLRLDRNRNLITAGEQDRLAALKVGVVGLSVGHAIAHILAAEGVCGELRLTDFDALELTNLNRVPATVLDIGLNKAVVAARRIAELDPYLDVHAAATGLTAGTIGDFLDGLDVVVEECDSLDVKVALREAARSRGIPVLMATSDRGLVDIERYDLDPGRPVLHGLLGEADVAALAGLTGSDKVPHVLRILDAGRLSARGAASLVEVGRTLTTWPQLAADVAVGAAAVAEAVRRIGLGEPLQSGRTRVDVAAALDTLDDPLPRPTSPAGPAAAVAEAARRAPSGGNMQPWHIRADNERVTVELAPEHTSTMDVAFRGSAVAVGAAMFNARVAAAAHGVPGEISVGPADGSPLRAVITLGTGVDDTLAALYGPMLDRETNRHRGTPQPPSPETVQALHDAAQAEGGRLRLLTSREEIGQAAAILAATDRIRYLDRRLHAEMISELRWPGDDNADGLDVAGLELDAAGMATLDILRRGDVMGLLAEWDAGGALGRDVTDRVLASSALGVVTVTGGLLVDYARGGAAVEALWIAAQQRGLGVQPVSPVFLYAQDDADLAGLAAGHVDELRELARRFRDLTGAGPQEWPALVLRFVNAPRPSLRSRRRPAEDEPLP